MKLIIVLFIFLFVNLYCPAQNADNPLTAPQEIELRISTPQPRMNETFQISIDINHIRANIFKSLAGKVRLSSDINTTNSEDITMNVTAIRTGKNEIGPLEFYIDQTKYTTNKISYEVVDPLPTIDKGVWFRKVWMSETKFCIIIEQRIPANSKTTVNPDQSISITTEAEGTEIVKFKSTYSINGLNGLDSHATTAYSSLLIKGEEKQFMTGYSVYYFEIADKNAKIRMTKDLFENMPTYFQFEDMIIQ